MRLLGKFLCLVTRKHRRGKPVKLMDDGEIGISRSLKVFACPRCGHITRYKLKSEPKPALKVAG